MNCKVGDKIELTAMVNDPCPIPAGATGTVSFIDGMGNIHIKWDPPNSHRSLALIPEMDKFIVRTQNKC